MGNGDCVGSGGGEGGVASAALFAFIHHAIPSRLHAHLPLMLCLLALQNSLGNIAFAYGFAQVLLEIQDTLKQPPKAVGTMRKAVTIGVSGAFVMYFSAATADYAALGNTVPGEVLERPTDPTQGIGFNSAPTSIILIANFCIVIHMISAYQASVGLGVRDGVQSEGVRGRGSALTASDPPSPAPPPSLPSAQVWAQPIFESIESNIKAIVLKRQAKQRAAAGDGDGKDHSGSGGAALDHPHAHHHHDLHKLPVVAEDGLEVDGTATSLDFSRGGSAGVVAGGTGGMRKRMSSRGSDQNLIVNTDPIPDLLPLGGQHAGARTCRVAVVDGCCCHSPRRLRPACQTRSAATHSPGLALSPALPQAGSLPSECLPPWPASAAWRCPRAA